MSNPERPASRIRNGLQVDGRTETIGSETVTVVLKDSRGVLLAYGNTVPTDATAGYATGCTFIDTNGAAGAVVYYNEGTAASCDFNVSPLTSGDITGVTAGTGLTGGGTSGGVTVSLASAYTPSHVVKFAGQFTTVGGDANEQASISGVLDTDIVIASLENSGTNTVTLLTAAAGTDVIDFVMSADPSNDAIINYQVLRAVA